MTSILSVGVRWCASAIFCRGEVNLWNILVPNLESGFVLGSVRRLTHRLVALSACRPCTERILASTSAMAVATVRKVPIIACAPILWILFIGDIAFDPHACIHTFEA